MNSDRPRNISLFRATRKMKRKMVPIDVDGVSVPLTRAEVKRKGSRGSVPQLVVIN